MRLRVRGSASAVPIDRLDRALAGVDTGDHVDPATADLVVLADAIRPAVHQSEAHRRLVYDRIMRAGTSGAAPRADAGSRDHTAPGMFSLVAEDELVGQMRLADVETITPTRAAEVAERLSALLERQGHSAGR